MKRILLAAASVFVLATGNSASAWADCAAAPLASTDDMVVSFVASQGGTQAAPSTQFASAVKEGMLIYDDTANALKVCNGTTWQTLQVGGGGVTAAGSVDGAVQFRGSTGNLAADDVNFVWDDTNNRLGIGTATPTVPLEVNGEAVISPARIREQSGWAAFMHKDVLTNGTSYAIMQSSTGLTMINAAAGQSVAFRIGGGATQPLKVTSGGVVISDVTTTTPHASAVLDITATTKGFLPPRMSSAQVTAIASPADGLIVYDETTDTIKLRANGAWVDLLAGSGSEADPQVGTLTATKWCAANAGGTAIDCTADAPATGAAGAASEVQFRDSGTGAFAADTQLQWDNTNKRLAINTAAPISPLHLSAEGAAVSQITMDAYTGSVSGNLLIGRKARGTIAAPTAAQANDVLIAVAGRGYGDTAFSGGSRAGMTMAASEAWTDTAQGTYIMFETTLNNSTTRAERMRITDGGNIGIGTNNPNTFVHLRSTGAPALTIESTGGADRAQLRLTNTVQSWFLDANPTSGDFTIDSAAAGGTEFTISRATGNVGIGTTSPSAPLQIGSTTAHNMLFYTDGSGIRGRYQSEANPRFQLFGDYFGGGRALLGFTRAGAGTMAAAGAGISVPATTTRELTFYTSDGTALQERIRIDGSGNVGIGETAPAANLHVKGAGDTTIMANNTGGNISQLRLKNDAAGGRDWGVRAWGTGSSGDFSIDDLTANARRFTIASNGNIAVGSVAGGPQSALHVAGGVQMGDDAASCVAAKYGTLRYNTDTLQLCGTGGWANVGTGGGSSGPSFLVRKSANQTVTSGTWTKLTWQTEEFDTNNNFATDRFTPTVAGKYIFVLDTSCSDGSQCYSAIRKNGGTYTQNQHVANNGGVPSVSIINMNGTTDYVEAFVWNTAGTTITQGYSVFSGSLLGGTSGGGGGGGTPGGADTQVQFNDGGTFGGDSAFVWDKTNNRMGIGAASSGASLYIQSDTGPGVGFGAVQIRGDNNTERFETYSSISPVFQGLRARGTVASPTAVQTGDLLAAFTGRGYDGTGYPGSSAMMRIEASENYTGSARGAGIAFQTTPNTTTTLATRMTIQHDGNVGIGTTTPGNLLTVQGAVNPTIGVNSTSGTNWAIFGNHYNGTRKSYWAYYPNNGTGGYAQLATDAAEDLRFGTSGAARMTIDGTGNVGIGLTNPSQKLDVVGTATANGIILKPAAGAAAPSAGTQVWESDGTHAWRATGNVGIGNSGPSYKLHVTGNGYITTNLGVGVAPVAHVGVYSYLDATNGTSYGVYGSANKTATASGAYYSAGAYSVVRANISSGVTDTGWMIGNFVSNLRHLGSDTGTLTNMYGTLVQIGHLNTAAAGTTTTNAYGLYVSPYQQVGTITNSYGVYLAAPGTGGTVTNNFGVYQAATTMKNYFAGSVGIGNSNPTEELDVTGDIKISGNYYANGHLYLGQNNTATNVYGSTGAANYLSLNASDDANDGARVILYGRTAGSAGRVYVQSSSNSTTDYVLHAVRRNSSGTTYNALITRGDGRTYFYGTNGSGSCYIDGDDPLTTCTSDARLKKDIEAIPNALESLVKLRGVTFNWKEEFRNDAGRKRYGIIAQELQAAFPQLVETGEDGYLQAAMDGLIPVFIEAVKELNTKRLALESKVSAQGTEIETLKAQNADILRRLEALEATATKQ